MTRRGDGLYLQVRLSLWIASLLSAIVLMAPAAASAVPCRPEGPDPCSPLPAFTTSAFADASIVDISDPNQTTVVARLQVQAPPDQALIDISAPLSLPVGGATLSALATLRSVVIPTISGGIISFGTAEATGIIDPLLVTPVVFPAASAGFTLIFDSGNAPMAVAFSGTIHVSGAELFFDHTGETALKAAAGDLLFFPAPELDHGRIDEIFVMPKPGDTPFAFSTVVKPNQTIDFSLDAGVHFELPVNFNTNFRDSRLDFTFTATPVPGPATLLLLVGGLAAIALVYGRMSTAKRRS
jgi:hypothetical protein